MYMAHGCFYVLYLMCGMLVVQWVLLEIGCCFSLGGVKYVVCLCKRCCVFCLNCEAWSCSCLCMGSMSVLSCRCCMFVSCVHHMAVLNAAFCMTYISSVYSSFSDRVGPQPTRVQDLSAVNMTSQSQADRVNRNAYRYSVVTLVLFICK